MENLKSEARKFILDNSPEWSEAVENGYDLRMEESEWLEWMVRYRMADLPSPVCNAEAGPPLHNNQRGTSNPAKQDYGTPTSLERLPMDIELEDAYVVHLEALLNYQQIQAIALQDAFNIFAMLGRNKEQEQEQQIIDLEDKTFDLFKAKCAQRTETEERLKAVRRFKTSD